MIRVILALAALLVSACARPAVTDAPRSEAPPKESSVKVDWQAAQSPEQCATLGGDWRPICLMAKPACVVKYKDAGKSCSDSSECSGRCQVKDNSAAPGTEVRGQCTANSDPCGCFQLVENGKASYPLCAD